MSSAIVYLKDFKRSEPKEDKSGTPKIWIDDPEYKRAVSKMVESFHEAQNQLEILKKIIFKKGRDTDNVQARLFCEFFGKLLRMLGMFKL